LSLENVIAIDCEYNSDKKPLSFGYTIVKPRESEHYLLSEILFKEVVDKRSFSIHGIPEFFLKKNGLDFFTKKALIKDLLYSSEYIVGFDLNNDFKVLQIRVFDLYKDKIVIDIKSVLDYAGLRDISLDKLACMLELNMENKGIYHTASFDSYITIKILEKIIALSNRSTKQILKDFSEVTSAKRDADIHFKDIDLSWMKDILNMPVKMKDLTPIYFYINSGNYILLSGEGVNVSCIPEEFIDFNRLNKLEKIDPTSKNCLNVVKFDSNFTKKGLKLFSNIGK